MFESYNEMVTIEELCTMLRIGKNKAYNLLRTGKIRAFRDDRLWMIPKSSVIEYIDNGIKATPCFYKCK